MNRRELLLAMIAAPCLGWLGSKAVASSSLSVRPPVGSLVPQRIRSMAVLVFHDYSRDGEHLAQIWVNPGNDGHEPSTLRDWLESRERMGWKPVIVEKCEHNPNLRADTITMTLRFDR